MWAKLEAITVVQAWDDIGLDQDSTEQVARYN